jgi:hypothetical protein
MVNMENFEEYMLLDADGELTDAEKKALRAFIKQHPELGNELDLFKAVRLEPDASVVYEGKEALLKTMPGPGKRTISLGAWWTYGAVAACIALAVLLFRKPGKEEPINTIAHIAQQQNTKTAEATTDQELHSTPKDPVAIENKHITQPVIAKIKKTRINSDGKKIIMPEQVTSTQRPEIMPEIPVANNHTEPITESKLQEYAQTPVIEPPVLMPTETTVEKAQRKLLVIAPVQEKFEGFADIREAVNGKIEKVKNIKERIKDTDIQFRFGNTELFTVKL